MRKRAGNDAQRFEDADDSCHGDGAHADKAHVVAIDFHGSHFGDGNDGGVDGHVNVAADEPDQRHEHKAGHDAAGAEHHGAAQAHHVAQAEDEADGVKAEDHAAALGQVAHEGDKLKVEILAPNMKCGDKEVVDGGDDGGLQQQLGLRAAFFSGDQHFGDCRRLRERKLAVHLAHKVAAQWNEEENAEAAAGEANENRLHRVRIEVQGVKRGKGEDGAGHHAARCAADADDDDVLKQTGAALEHASEADGEDRDGDGGFHSLADFEPRVSRGDAEDDAEQDAPEDRAPGEFRLPGLRVKRWGCSARRVSAEGRRFLEGN